LVGRRSYSLGAERSVPPRLQPPTALAGRLQSA